MPHVKKELGYARTGRTYSRTFSLFMVLHKLGFNSDNLAKSGWTRVIFEEHISVYEKGLVERLQLPDQ